MTRSTPAPLVALLLVTTACTTTDDESSHLFGPRPPTLDRALILKDERDTDRLVAKNTREAVWRELNIGQKDWKSDNDVTPSDYTAAGYNYVYRQCTNYFDALILLQNKTGFTNDLVSSGGATSGAILGLAKVSSAAIGIVAAGFGFVGSTISAFDKRALITPYATETKTLILDGLDAYRVRFPPGKVGSVSEAIANVQHFAEICTYSGITRAAKQALTSTKSSAAPPPDAQSQTLKAAISAKLSVAPALGDSELAALYWFIFKGGTPCGKEQACAAVVKALPQLKDQLIGNDKKYIDPAPLKDKAGGELTSLYATDATFKKLVDEFEKGAGDGNPVVAPPAAPPAAPPVTPPAIPAPGQPEAVPAPPPPAPPPAAPQASPPTSPTGIENFGQANFTGKREETPPAPSPAPK